MKNNDNLSARWGKKINWENRVKAVCKPCWEIKYCPYGPLVEDFPIAEENNPKRCVIFGHICPVYRVAEPFTETKELRKISRNISRSTMFKVISRDGRVCQLCGKNVLIGEEQFDHIIPWSKGGSSEESNIRLLCSECNKKRSNKFEKEMLVNSFKDHSIEKLKLNIEQINDLLISVSIINESGNDNISLTDFINIAEKITQQTLDKEIMDVIYNIIMNIDILKEITELGYLSKKETEIIKYRWGYIDKKIHSYKETANKYNTDIKDIFEIEKYLFEYIGFDISDSDKNINNYISD